MTGAPRPLLGVLGGMGPLATVDFLQKLIEETPARGDEDHVPVLVYSVPQIPSRPGAIIADGDSPLPAMLDGMRTLKRGGCAVAAIACNTAHYWHEDLVRESGLPIIHIADAACSALTARAPRPRAVGLIATKGTVAAGFFQERLAACGCDCVLSSDEEQETLVLPAITAVKSHDLARAHELAVRACMQLQARGAEAIVLGCTEMPLAVEYGNDPITEACIDPTRELAKACVAWWQTNRPR